MADLSDYGALIRSGQAAVPDYAADEARRQLLALHKAQEKRLTAEAEREAREQNVFEHDLATVLTNPNAQGYSALIAKHPKLAQQIKSSWDVYDDARQKADLQSMGEVYSAAANGKHDLAGALMKRRIDADKAAGHEVDPHDQAILDALNSGDPTQQKAAQGMIGVSLAAVTGPEKFEQTLGALTKGSGGYTLDAGAARFGGDNQMIAHSPFIKDAEGNIRLWNDPAAGDAAAPPAAAPATVANLPAPQAAVASTLASSGIPSHVVAGFLGNFDTEGGYGGAKGDGGTAHGIGQWRGERAANFEKVVGKPIADASPEEQAGYVVWEMQHPEAAGMTVTQRDAILTSKSPQEAAAKIDQFYERSSGQHRDRRVQSAVAYADGTAPATAADSRFPVLFSKKPTTRILTAEEAKAKGLPVNQVYQLNDSTGQVTPISGTGDSEDALDPQTTSFYAQQILAGGQMPPLGMGKSAAQARQRIMREVAKQAGGEGLTGADLATQITHYKAASKALGVLETQAGTVETNEQTALMNGQQFIDRSKELSGQTRFPIVNSATQAYLRHTGDPTIVAMDAAWNTFVTEYAKVVAGSPSGAGVLSDSARHEAQETMRGNYTVAQKESAFKQMQADMANRMEAIRARIAKGYRDLTTNPRKAVRDFTGGNLPKGARIVGTYQGKRVIEVNGRRMVEQ